MASSADNDVCTICNDSLNIFSIGHCNHPLCYKCSTRMRYLCKQMYCPICRADLPQVVFVTKEDRYENIDKKSFCICHATKIFSETSKVYDKWQELLANNCKLCNSTFKTFVSLKHHMSNEHGLQSCNICEKHLMLFSYERKFYNRQELVRHKKTGDVDDPSYKGHPSCKFCDMRYFDNDELVLHLRKEHYFCHICEVDGFSNEFYCDYPDLLNHFKEKHFVCIEGECANVQWSNVFRNSIDFNLHIANQHSNSLNKNHAKQLRQINIDFNYKKHRDTKNRRDGNYESEHYGRQNEIAAPTYQSYDDSFPSTITTSKSGRNNIKQNNAPSSAQSNNKQVNRPIEEDKSIKNAEYNKAANRNILSHDALSNDNEFPTLSIKKPSAVFNISSWNTGEPQLKNGLPFSSDNEFPKLVAKNKMTKSIPKNSSMPNFNYSSIVNNTASSFKYENTAPKQHKNKSNKKAKSSNDKLDSKEMNCNNHLEAQNNTLSDLAKKISEPVKVNDLIKDDVHKMSTINEHKEKNKTSKNITVKGTSTNKKISDKSNNLSENDTHKLINKSNILNNGQRESKEKDNILFVSNEQPKSIIRDDSNVVKNKSKTESKTKKKQIKEMPLMDEKLLIEYNTKFLENQLLLNDNDTYMVTIPSTDNQSIKSKPDTFLSDNLFDTLSVNAPDSGDILQDLKDKNFNYKKNNLIEEHEKYYKDYPSLNNPANINKNSISYLIDENQVNGHASTACDLNPTISYDGQYSFSTLSSISNMVNSMHNDNWGGMRNKYDDPDKLSHAREQPISNDPDKLSHATEQPISNVKRPPPGFGKPNIRTPPPGFASVTSSYDHQQN